MTIKIDGDLAQADTDNKEKCFTCRWAIFDKYDDKGLVFCDLYDESYFVKNVGQCKEYEKGTAETI